MRFPLLFLALLATASAQETLFHIISDTKSNTAVDVVAQFNRPAPRGYLPVHVTMANHEMTGKSVTLNFESSTDGASLKSKTSFTFDSPADKVTDHDILVPLATATGGTSYGGGGTRVTAYLGGSYGSGDGAISSSFSADNPAVLFGEKLYTPNSGPLDSAISSHYGSGQFAAKFDSKQMPDDWRAYSGYDSILMTDAEWTSASPGARHAMTAWVRLGGQLVIYTESGATAASLGLPAETSAGEIILKAITSSTLDPKATVDLVSKGRMPQQKSIAEDYTGSWPLQTAFGVRGFNYAVFIVILIAFGVVVGPVNLFVFAKSGRRHRLFITTPLISLAASLILIVLILLQDGFGGRGQRLVLMEVRPDNGENAAYVHQEQFSRTGVLTGARFTISEAAALSPVPLDFDNRWARLTSRDASGTYSANFRDGKIEHSGDWFQSRSEQGHILDAVIPTRGRIEKTTTTGNPQLLSTFDFPLETIYYLDSANQWWRADRVQPGTKFSPVMVGEPMVRPDLDKEAGRFAKRDRAAFEKLRKRPSAFIAITDAAPAVETYTGIKWQETHTVVTGPVITP